MSKSTGKIIGVIIGLALGRFRAWPLAVVGLVIGHLYDIGFFSKKTTPGDSENSSNTNRPVVDANPYVVLDIPETASLEEIEQAYRRKISDYHPDKVANAAPELKELAELRAREINAAFDELQKLRKQP